MRIGWHRLYPSIIPILLTGIFQIYMHNIFEFMDAIKFDLTEFFSGSFNFSTVLTGFLFSIYCFIVVTSNPFIEKIQTTSTFKEVKSFLATTTSLGLLSAIFSLILSCFKLDLLSINSFQCIVLDSWVFIFTLNVCYFFCALRHFMVLSNDIPARRTFG